MKPLVKASAVNNLSDARYFAARGAEWLGFNIDGNTLPISKITEIISWLEGPQVVMEFLTDSTDDIITHVSSLPHCEAIQLSAFYDTPDADLLAQTLQIPVWAELVADNIAEAPALIASWDDRFPSHITLLIDFARNGISWQHLDESLIELLYDISLTRPLILELAQETQDMAHIVSRLPQLYALSIKGGEEERVGVKSFDELDEFFDAWDELS